MTETLSHCFKNETDLTKFSITPGFSVVERRRKTGVVGFQHRLKREDAMKWFQQKVRFFFLASLSFIKFSWLTFTLKLTD